MKDKPTKPNGTLNFGDESWPVYWDLVDDSVYWLDTASEGYSKMDEWKSSGYNFKPLPSEGVREIKAYSNTPFKWPDYWGYAAFTEDEIDRSILTDTFEDQVIKALKTPKIGDNVKHPNHYNQDGQIECIDAIKAALGLEGFAAYCRGNTIKYLWRYKRKGGVEDLKKSQQYLTWLIETEKEIANADKA